MCLPKRSLRCPNFDSDAAKAAHDEFKTIDLGKAFEVLHEYALGSFIEMLRVEYLRRLQCALSSTYR